MFKNVMSSPAGRGGGAEEGSADARVAFEALPTRHVHVLASERNIAALPSGEVAIPIQVSQWIEKIDNQLPMIAIPCDTVRMAPRAESLEVPAGMRVNQDGYLLVRIARTRMKWVDCNYQVALRLGSELTASCVVTAEACGRGLQDYFLLNLRQVPKIAGSRVDILVAAPSGAPAAEAGLSSSSSGGGGGAFSFIKASLGGGGRKKSCPAPATRAVPSLLASNASVGSIGRGGTSLPSVLGGDQDEFGSEAHASFPLAMLFQSMLHADEFIAPSIGVTTPPQFAGAFAISRRERGSPISQIVGEVVVHMIAFPGSFYRKDSPLAGGVAAPTTPRMQGRAAPEAAAAAAPSLYKALRGGDAARARLDGEGSEGSHHRPLLEGNVLPFQQYLTILQKDHRWERTWSILSDCRLYLQDFAERTRAAACDALDLSTVVGIEYKQSHEMGIDSVLIITFENDSQLVAYADDHEEGLAWADAIHQTLWSQPYIAAA